MIKYVLINRLVDGLILCETSDITYNQSFENMKVQVKNYHRSTTSKFNTETSNIKQISNASYGIYYRINNFVVFTAIAQLSYPVKLINGFLDSISSSFFDEAKCLLGSSNITSRIQNIQGSHYFVRFDRVIKQKKKEFDDPNSIRNVDRMKKELQSIHDIMKQNMNMIDKRQQDLVNAQQKAFKINQESKRFEKKTKQVVWQLWFRKNVIWIVLVLAALLLFYIF